MNTRQKRAFIRELTRNIINEAVAKVPHMPEEWDGIELRWYLAEKFTASTFNTTRDSFWRTRKRDYENEVLVRNL